LYVWNFFIPKGGNSGLKVSSIIQKAGIIVDEKGTEAVAATGKTFTHEFQSQSAVFFSISTEIEVIDKFGGDPREFVANHPFVFYIEDDITGAKLFSGVINNPEY
jgi:serpin B